MFQFTLPRGERLLVKAGMTELRSFNSRSRVGSDLAEDNVVERLRVFQFTLPRGERPRRGQCGRVPSCVSIHAPAWGATLLTVGSDTRQADAARPRSRFNSRSRVGSDVRTGRLAPTSSGFQFTLPRGERQVLGLLGALGPSFNSRSRVGSDSPRRLPISLRSLFQFTLPRGERQSSFS